MSIKRIEAEWPELDGVAYAQLSPEEYALARACIHALRGLPIDALSGGWCYDGMNKEALKLEAENKALRLDLAAMTAGRDALRAEVDRLTADNVSRNALLIDRTVELNRARDEVQHLIERNREQAEEIERLRGTP